MDRQWYQRSEAWALVVGAVATFLDQILGFGVESELLISMWGAISAYCLSRGYIKGKAVEGTDGSAIR